MLAVTRTVGFRSWLVLLLAMGAGCAGGGGPGAAVSSESDPGAEASSGEASGEVPSPATEVANPEADAAGPADAAPDAAPAEVVAEVATGDQGLPAGPRIQLPSEAPPVIAEHPMNLGGWSMAPGEEETWCVVKRLGNPDVLWVSAVHTVLAKGSHHLIIYKSDADQEQTQPFHCTPFTETLKGTSFPLMISQVPEETLQFPPGVAFRFEPNQMVRLEAHYLNYYPEPIIANADVTFRGIAADQVVAEGNLLFYGSPDFQIPPNSETTSDWRYLEVPEGTEVFAVTGHTHQAGTNVEVEHAPNGTEPGTPIYPLDQPFEWSEAPVIPYQPSRYFKAGEGFRFRCSWKNTTNQTLQFGESGNDEMCFLWAYYYPSYGYRMCLNAKSLGFDSVCCPSSVCDLIGQFF
jgi:hypothetical protein